MTKGEDGEAFPTDGRKLGDWRSRYPRLVWFWVSFEAIYSLTLLLSGLFIILFGGVLAAAQCDCDKESGTVTMVFISVEVANSSVKWIALSAAGMIGGVVAVLKWLLHSLAAGYWNEDRRVWRLITPFNSAAISLFTGFLLVSGIIPFIRRESFESIYALLGLGFVFGYFSDNVLAALYRWARQVFGTLNS